MSRDESTGGKSAPDVTVASNPSILISGNARVGKLIVIQHAASVSVNNNFSLIPHFLSANLPIGINEQVGSLEFQTNLLLRSPESGRTVGNVLAACRMAQNVIQAIVRSAEYNVDHARIFLDRMIAVVTTLRALTRDAEALLSDIADLHGATRDYYAAIAQMETLVQSPTRRRSTDDLIALGTCMLNAGDYQYAQQVFEAVSTELNTHGPMSPWGDDDKLTQLSKADQYRLLWIPHEMGSPQLTIWAAPALLRQVRGISPQLEGAILHRLGRAQGDLGLLRRDRRLLSRSVKSHQMAMSKSPGEYNFFEPMALYYVQQALRPGSGERAFEEAYDLSSGLGEGTRPHIDLLDARRAGAEGRVFEGIEAASRAIDTWQQHPHIRGVIDGLVTRAELRFKLGTASSLEDAASDLFAARNFARARGFDIDPAAVRLLKKCLVGVDGRKQVRILNSAKDFEAAHPRLAQRPGVKTRQIIDDLTQHRAGGRDQAGSVGMR